MAIVFVQWEDIMAWTGILAMRMGAVDGPGYILDLAMEYSGEVKGKATLPYMALEVS